MAGVYEVISAAMSEPVIDRALSKLGLTRLTLAAGWGLYALTLLNPPTALVGLAIQALYDPVLHQLEGLTRRSESLSPLSRTVSRLAAASAAQPILLVIDHAETVDPAVAAPLSLLVRQAGSRCLVVIGEHGRSAFGDQFALAARLGADRTTVYPLDLELDADDLAAMARAEVPELEDAEIAVLADECQTLGALARVLTTPALAPGTAMARTIADLDVRRLAAPDDTHPLPLMVSLVAKLGGGIPVDALVPVSTAVGLDAGSDLPEGLIRQADWAIVPQSLRARALDGAGLHLSLSTVQSAAKAALDAVVDRLPDPGAGAWHEDELRCAHLAVALSAYLPADTLVAAAATVALKSDRLRGLPPVSSSSAVAVLQRCDAAGIEAPEVEGLRSELMAGPEATTVIDQIVMAQSAQLTSRARLATAIEAHSRVLATESREWADRQVSLQWLLDQAARLDALDLDRADRAAAACGIALAVRRWAPDAAVDLLPRATRELPADVIDMIAAAKRVLEGDTTFLEFALIARYRTLADQQPPLQLVERAEVLAVLCDLLADTHQYGEAVRRCGVLVELRAVVLGSDHPDTLATRGNLASWLGRMGRVEEAVEECRRLLTDRTRVLGGDHPDTLATRHNLAYLLGSIGRVDEAVEELRRLLTDFTRVLGGDHPDTLTTRGNLAYLLGELGRVEEAVDEFRRLLTDRTRVLGGDHPDTLTTRHNLASLLGSIGRVDEAVEELRRLLTDFTRVLGGDHPNTLTTRGNL
ncbi:MAG: tetratricopeptide repeat protein, partial [Acidimicrobiales bacterium]|nr:tetratricopeptide repeat protein [Acidimicrobiales bacterium]